MTPSLAQPRLWIPLVGALLSIGCTIGAFFLPAEVEAPVGTPSATIVAWNDLGMHCIDPDFSVFSILPPFNTINAHAIVDGDLVENGSGYTVTFEGVADATGSINTTSAGKTNFWDHVQDLFGVSPPVDEGLTGIRMPGSSNTPQAMTFDNQYDWFQGEGIPITPIDDALRQNAYPLMRVVLRDSAGVELAATNTVVPTSRELECSICHASGASYAARPSAGWAYHPDPTKDDRFNILRLHDERELSNPSYVSALQTAGYLSSGLYDTVVSAGKAILCANCHGSNALPGTGIAGISPLTQAIHSTHAQVQRPDGRTLQSISDRSSCFLCHPGRVTQCLRGAMGAAIGPDGEHSMDCQSCHGGMAEVGDANRVGWLDQPTCQNCHPGTATNNPGQIRYTTVFDSNGQRRTPTSNRFATDPNTPSTGFSLYRFSKGHENLQCSACHGPPHAIYPSNIENDNVQSLLLQGHVGTITDCTVCHDDLEDNEYAGPHNMHPVSNKWTRDNHGDAAQSEGMGYCRSCHGANDQGTVLSLAQGDRSYLTSYGSHTFFRGEQIGCYACHNGPNGGNQVINARPVVPSPTYTTPADVDLPLTLSGTDPDSDPLTFRIVSQPKHGTVAIQGVQVTYKPSGSYTGNDSFTYAARDGKIDSNLGTVGILVTAKSCQGTIVNYGFGVTGSSGILPQLRVTGCPERGGAVNVVLRQGLGGAIAIVGFGTARANLETPFGNTLRIGGFFANSPLTPLSGSGPGAGGLTIPIPLPPTTPLGTYTLQAFVVDPGSPTGFASTNGVEVIIN